MNRQLVLPIAFFVATITPLFCGVTNAAEPNTLTAEEAADGWVLLFDGQSMDSWRNYRKDTVSDGWKVVDGAIARVAGGAGDIITKDQFDAFELTMDYKISAGGNSGLMFHVSEQENTPWMTGPEIQIQDNKEGRDPQKSGWLYQLYSADVDATNPAGQWNTLRVLISPEKSAVYMNDKKYYEFVKGSDQWNERVAKSKFGSMANFGKPSKGHISLQDHGDAVEFRNLKIRVLQ